MVSSGGEIISLQFGHYSNFIGVHWWNCQEASFEYDPGSPSEINHDAMFREGQTARGDVTYTPRMLLVDLKGSLGCLPESGKLYESPTSVDTSLPLWPPEQVSVQYQDSEPRNEFLEDLEQGETTQASLPDGLKEKGLAIPKLYHLEDSVKTWSDFLRPHLHPRSINIINEYQHNDSSLPFDTFPLGHSLWNKPDFNEEYTDRVRLYLEESDNLQGFQILMDCFDGFSGLACGGLQFLRDEYPSKTALCFACQPPLPMQETKPKQSLIRVLNQALALSSLAEHASLFVPITGSTQAWETLGSAVNLPHVTYRPELYYHSSAIVAATLDTVSLLYRLKSSSERLTDLSARLGMYGRTAAAVSVSLPFPLQTRSTLLDTLENWGDAEPFTHSLTPVGDLTSRQWQQTYVLRGVPETKLMREEQRDQCSSNPAYSCRSVAQLLRTYLQFTSPTPVATQVTTADTAFKTGTSFPHIFSDYVTTDGFIDGKPRLPYLGVEKIPILGGLHSTPSLGPLLEDLHTEAKKVNIRSVHQFVDSGLESTELTESLEQLMCLSESYSESQMDL